MVSAFVRNQKGSYYLDNISADLEQSNYAVPTRMNVGSGSVMGSASPLPEGLSAEQFGDYLGKGFAMIAGVVNPEVFVLGGGVSKAGPVILDYIKKYYVKYTYKGCRDAEFVLATLGNDAGIFGSARLVIEE